MELLRPVFWGQGMFLQPQHFQQQDQYHDAQLYHYFQLFQPFCWGVQSLMLNEAALQNFLLEIEQCEIVTWDGTVMRFRGNSPASNARIEPRSFEQELDPTGKPLSVYLGIRRLQLEESNVLPIPGVNGGSAGEARSGHQRFSLLEAKTPDLCNGESQSCEIQYLLYQVHILFDLMANRSHDYELVKIAEIRRAADGKGGILWEQYIPPSVTIRSSSTLERMIKDIRDRLTAKGQELSHLQQQQGVELSTRNVGYFLMIQTLNRYIPLFHHYLELDPVHPVVVYGTLRQLIGELSTFSSSISVLGAKEALKEGDLPPYRHDQLWPCFQLAVQRVHELLNELTATPVLGVELRHDGEFFAATIDPQFLEGDNRYYLAIKTDVRPGEMYAVLQQVGKITSRDHIRDIMNSALPGLTIDWHETPPDELRGLAHYRYFLIDQRSEDWRFIRQAGNIAIFSTDPRRLPPDTEIRLLVIHGNK